MLTARALCSALLVASTLLGCKSKDKPEPAPPEQPRERAIVDAAPAAAAESRASPYILRDGAIIRIRPDGTDEKIADFPDGRFCRADQRAQALWLLSAAGVSIYDLQTGALSLLVRAPGGIIEAFDIRFGDGEGTIGNADGLSDDVALVVMATKRLSIRSEIICEGDREAYCYEDSDSDDPDLWELQEHAAAIKARYDELRLGSTEVLSSIVARRLATPVAERGLAKPPSPPALELTGRCLAEPDDCGSGDYLGEGYWSIIVGNDRGDYFHEDRALYDADAKAYVNADTGKRSQTPDDALLPEQLLAPDRSGLLTPSGRWYSFREKRVLSAHDGAQPCGFVIPPSKP